MREGERKERVGLSQTADGTTPRTSRMRIDPTVVCKQCARSSGARASNTRISLSLQREPLAAL
jgi:hypothetical protein